jgi:hypothetical protein
MVPISLSYTTPTHLGSPRWWRCGPTLVRSAAAPLMVLAWLALAVSSSRARRAASCSAAIASVHSAFMSRTKSVETIKVLMGTIALE